MSIRSLDGQEIAPQTPLWRYMELSKFLMLLEGNVFIPCLSKLRNDSDPKEAMLPAHSEAFLPELLFSQAGGDDTLRWLEKHNTQSPSAGDPRIGRDQLFDEWINKLSARRAVWCWGSTRDALTSGEPWENLAMWNSYAR